MSHGEYPARPLVWGPAVDSAVGHEAMHMAPHFGHGLSGQHVAGKRPQMLGPCCLGSCRNATQSPSCLRLLHDVTVHCQQELPGGFPCHVPGHTGVSGSVTQLGVVDLQVPPAGQDPQPGASLRAHRHRQGFRASLLASPEHRTSFHCTAIKARREGHR